MESVTISAELLLSALIAGTVTLAVISATLSIWKRRGLSFTLTPRFSNSSAF